MEGCESSRGWERGEFFFARAFVWGDVDPHGGGLGAGEPDGSAVVVEIRAPALFVCVGGGLFVCVGGGIGVRCRDCFRRKNLLKVLFKVPARHQRVCSRRYCRLHRGRYRRRLLEDDGRVCLLLGVSLLELFDVTVLYW